MSPTNSVLRCCVYTPSLDDTTFKGFLHHGNPRDPRQSREGFSLREGPWYATFFNLIMEAIFSICLAPRRLTYLVWQQLSYQWTIVGFPDGGPGACFITTDYGAGNLNWIGGCYRKSHVCIRLDGTHLDYLGRSRQGRDRRSIHHQLGIKTSLLVNFDKYILFCGG